MSRKFVIGFLFAAALVLVGRLGSRMFKQDGQEKVAQGELAQLVKAEQLRDGDIIFQASRSSQSRAIEKATHSAYSHCGLIFRTDTGRVEWYVLEAVQPVKWTALDHWIARGVNGHYVIKRLEDGSALGTGQVQALRAAAEKHVGKDYDLLFGWDDDQIYCSELVWKAYEEAMGIRLGEPQRLSDLDLTDPVVRTKMQERYGDQLPVDEPMVSPGRIFESALLRIVGAGGRKP